MIQLMTDSTIAMNKQEIEARNIIVVPLSVRFGNDQFRDGIDLTNDEFYKLLTTRKEFPCTSAPSPMDFLTHFEKAKEDEVDLIYLSTSSGISSTIQSALIAKDMAEYDRIFVVDSHHSIQGLRLLMLNAIQMVNDGKTAEEIVDETLKLRDRVVVYSAIDTMTYLSKGGRISKALALIGNAIKIKPMINVDEVGKIQVYSKARGTKNAFAKIIESIKEVPIDHKYPVCFGYTSGKENMQTLMEEVIPLFKIENYDVSQIGCAIGAHIGPGGYDIYYIKKV